MGQLETFVERNAGFCADGFDPTLRMMPSRRTVVIGCVDPRVDPTAVLGLLPGEAAVIRNVGGRVTPDVLAELALLGAVSAAAGVEMGPGWELVVLQHTDCGVTRIADHPGMADLLGVAREELAAKAVSDPHAAVAGDVAVLRGLPALERATVSGLVYDVGTGRVEVVPDRPTRPAHPSDPPV